MLPRSNLLSYYELGHNTNIEIIHVFTCRVYRYVHDCNTDIACDIRVRVCIIAKFMKEDSRTAIGISC